MQRLFPLEPIRLFLATVFLCLYGAMAAVGVPAPTLMKEGSRVYVEQILEPFPNIRMVDAEGRTHRLEEFQGKVVLLNFWATWCGPCIRELPLLNTLQTRFPEILSVVTVSQDRKGFKVITPFLQTHPAPVLTHLWDERSLEFRKLRMKGLPMSFLIAPTGELIATIQGETDWLDEDFIALIHTYSL